MLPVFRKELQILFKEKGTFFWLIILPVAFIVLYASVFGSASNSNITIHYIDQDNTAVSKQFVQTLSNVKGFETAVDTSTTRDDQIEKIRNGKLSSLVIIPKGFGDNLKSGDKANIEFYRTSVTDQTVESAKALLDNIINSYREGKIKSTLAFSGKSDVQIQQIMASPVVLKEVNEDVKNVTVAEQLVPGMMVMFVFFVIISMIRGFIKERESGMLARLRSTPMKPGDYLAGMWSSFILTVIIQCTALLGFGHYVYKLDLGNLPAIIAIVISLAICATGIGLAISFLVKSENQGIALTQIVVMGGAALGGLWIPFDILPSFAQKIGYLMPQYWAQKGLQDVMVRGADISVIVPNIAVLLLFGIAGVFIALLRFKRYILSAAS
ncbi:MAG: ABC transporter permease [Bacillota bacterium]|nr:ABC transporter permease [Bacillota bacterium]